MKSIFIFKNGESERDAVHYIDIPLFQFSCGHYFSSLHYVGPCYSTAYLFEDIKEMFDNNTIKTILTLEDFEKLYFVFDFIHNNMGYEIEKDSEKYNACIEKINSIKYIEEKLLSKENDNLIKEIQEEEYEYVEEEYNIFNSDFKDILDNNYQEYWDNGIISYVFEGTEEIGREKWNDYYGSFDNNIEIEDYIDFESFGEDLLESNHYYKLSDRRIVYLNY